MKQKYRISIKTISHDGVKNYWIELISKRFTTIDTINNHDHRDDFHGLRVYIVVQGFWKAIQISAFASWYCTRVLESNPGPRDGPRVLLCGTRVF